MTDSCCGTALSSSAPGQMQSSAPRVFRARKSTQDSNRIQLESLNRLLDQHGNEIHLGMESSTTLKAKVGWSRPADSPSFLITCHENDSEVKSFTGFTQEEKRPRLSSPDLGHQVKCQRPQSGGAETEAKPEQRQCAVNGRETGGVVQPPVGNGKNGCTLSPSVGNATVMSERDGERLETSVVDAPKGEPRCEPAVHGQRGTEQQGANFTGPPPGSETLTLGDQRENLEKESLLPQLTLEKVKAECTVALNRNGLCALTLNHDRASEANCDSTSSVSPERKIVGGPHSDAWAVTPDAGEKSSEGTESTATTENGGVVAKPGDESELFLRSGVQENGSACSGVPPEGRQGCVAQESAAPAVAVSAAQQECVVTGPASPSSDGGAAAGDCAPGGQRPLKRPAEEDLLPNPLQKIFKSDAGCPDTNGLCVRPGVCKARIKIDVKKEVERVLLERLGAGGADVSVISASINTLSRRLQAVGRENQRHDNITMKLQACFEHLQGRLNAAIDAISRGATRTGNVRVQEPLWRPQAGLSDLAAAAAALCRPSPDVIVGQRTPAGPVFAADATGTAAAAHRASPCTVAPQLPRIHADVSSSRAAAPSSSDPCGLPRSSPPAASPAAASPGVRPAADPAGPATGRLARTQEPPAGAPQPQPAPGTGHNARAANGEAAVPAAVPRAPTADGRHGLRAIAPAPAKAPPAKVCVASSSLPPHRSNALAAAQIAVATSAAQAASVWSGGELQMVPDLVTAPRQVVSIVSSSANSVIDLTEEDESQGRGVASGGGVAPAGPGVAPAGPSVAPAGPSVAPAGPSVAPAGPSVAPAGPSVAPAEPSVAPAEPSVAPAEPGVAQLPPLPNPPAAPSLCPLPPEAAKSLPPQEATLMVTRSSSQIVLCWTVREPDARCAAAEAFYLYACHQELAGSPPVHWRRVGEVKALRLPMACTLSQFGFGKRYFFAVRGRDSYGRYGPFCEPQCTELNGA